jgi:hypothetical protein
VNEITSNEFAVLVRQTGLVLTEAQANDLRVGYRLIQAMADLVRVSRDREAEPAHIFTFDQDRVR